MPKVSWGETRRLEFQELLQHRNVLAARPDGFACTQFSSFEQHVGLPQVSQHRRVACSRCISQYINTHARKVLEASIAELKLAISDQNLDLLPYHEERIAALKELKFIDDNSTVLIKSRVACEVRLGPSPFLQPPS